MVDIKHQDGDGWGKDYLIDAIRERREAGERASKVARKEIEQRRRAGTYYELPVWQREALEDTAERNSSDY